MTFAEKIFAELDDEIANDDADLASGSTKCVCVGDEVCCVLFESIAASGTRSGEIFIYIYIYILISQVFLTYAWIEATGNLVKRTLITW